jgi:hypothetical protein
MTMTTKVTYPTGSSQITRAFGTWERGEPDEFGFRWLKFASLDERGTPPAEPYDPNRKQRTLLTAAGEGYQRRSLGFLPYKWTPDEEDE